MTLRHYLRYHAKTLLLVFFCSVIHTIVLFIYGNDLEPIIYALILCSAFLFILGILDFRQKKKKHALLHSYDPLTDLSLNEMVPEQESNAIEYQKIILKLEDLYRTQLIKHNNRETELSDFYTMWVHQIKTPIAAMRLLLQTSPENITAMKSELFKIERYVDIILGYLRIDDLSSDLLLKQYSLDTLVKQAVKKYTPLFIQSKLSLQLEHLSASVVTDEKWFVFVLEQLLSNAIKYTKKGGIRIFSDTIQTNSAIKTTLIIEDTGIGIYPEDLPRIFERSYTGYNGRTDKKASGLGLYLCKKILTKLGHAIAITSVPEQGTRVTITFVTAQNPL